MSTWKTLCRAVGALALAAILSATCLADTVTHFHPDISGSPTLATNAAGDLVWKQGYRPYGEKLGGPATSVENAIGFHGKPFDDSTGLSYMGARYYDPGLGRFLSVDPAAVKPDDVHSFNRYAYANNNPYRYVDPDGRNSIEGYGWIEPKIQPIPPPAAIRGSFQHQQAANLADALAQGGVGPGVAGAAAGILKGVGKGLSGYAAKGGVAIEGASSAAFKAAERAGEFAVPLKHLPDAGGRWAKFAEGTNPNALIKEALSSSSARLLPNSVEGSYKVVTDLGRIVGTNGETSLRVIIGQDGTIWTAFPVK